MTHPTATTTDDDPVDVIALTRSHHRRRGRNARPHLLPPCSGTPASPCATGLPDTRTIRTAPSWSSLSTCFSSLARLC